MGAVIPSWEILAAEGTDILRWLKDDYGMHYRLMCGRQAYERPDGSYLFWGRLHVGNVDGGDGLIRDAGTSKGLQSAWEPTEVDSFS